mgnify:CR=1 FL=1
MGHQPEKKRLISWLITEEKKGIENFRISFFPAGDSQKEKRVFLEGIRLVSAFGESRDLVCSPCRSDLVVQSSRFAVLVGNREILKLSMVPEPVLKKMFKKKREKVGSA